MKTKIIIGLITVVAIGVLATGIVLAHNPYPAVPVYPNDMYSSNDGYYGWTGGCYGYNQPYNQYPPYQEPDTSEQSETPSTPEQPTQPGYNYPPRSPNQDYYPRSYGRGCWGW